MKSLERQEGGNHYKEFAIEPAEFSLRNQLGFAEGNVVKYASRHAWKGKLDDITKAIHYLTMIAEVQYGAEISFSVVITEVPDTTQGAHDGRSGHRE